MTEIEQAARAEAKRRYRARKETPNYGGFGFTDGVRWLAEYLLSDENVEKAARAITHPSVFDEDALWLNVGRRNQLRSQAVATARAALSAALGKEQR